MRPRQKLWSAWLCNPRHWLLFTPGFPLILNHQFSMTSLKLSFAYMSHCPWTAGVGLISHDFWCLEPPVCFLRINGEKQVHLQYFGSSSPACISIPLLLICLVPWITTVKHSRPGAACAFLPLQRRWVVWPQLQSPDCCLKLYCLESFCLRCCLIPSFMPESALNPVCCWCPTFSEARRGMAP